MKMEIQNEMISMCEFFGINLLTKLRSCYGFEVIKDTKEVLRWLAELRKDKNML